jgi:hypothetical protein
MKRNRTSAVSGFRSGFRFLGDGFEFAALDGVEE